MRALIFLLVGLVSACSAPDMRPPVGPPEMVAEGTSASTTSLFSSDASILSDADIDRILKFKYALPKETRVAVLALNAQHWFGYSDEMAKTNEEIKAGFISALKKAPTVRQAAYLPSLLVPSNRTVAYFREAAARYQADTLVIYQSSCQTYEKYRFFSGNASKSFCTVEAVVLDVRTGIVPFSTTATQEFTAVQTPDDANMYETTRKAELNAIRDSLGRVGSGIAGFLAGQQSL